MTMSKRNLKLMSAGVLVAVAFGVAVGVVALRVARATPGSGVTATTIAGPVALDEIDVHGNAGGLKVKIATQGEWVSRVVHYSVAPGGFFGWHSHPGPVFVHITEGTLTYERDDGDVVEYAAGTGFVDFGDVHNARNRGTESLEIIALFLSPAGVPIRTDEPQP
jgi:quercetin dioxygenase-like cupin family protein